MPGLLLAHQLLGYALAFAVAPLALQAFATPRRHRLWGRLYVGCMLLLYLSGTVFTLSQHEPGSFALWRNLLFNFLGSSLAFIGWRLAWRRRHGRLAAVAGDRLLRAAVIGLSGALAAMGALHHFPSAVLGALGLWLGLRGLREQAQAAALMLAHLRCMLASVFYLLTVLSLVHVRSGPGDLKWLWPAVIGVTLLCYAAPKGQLQPQRLRFVVRSSLALLAAAALFVLTLSTPLKTLQ